MYHKQHVFKHLCFTTNTDKTKPSILSYKNDCFRLIKECIGKNLYIQITLHILVFPGAFSGTGGGWADNRPTHPLFLKKLYRLIYF